MKLYIAEKPSLGRAIANALPKPHKNNDGFIEAANGDIVTWCIGHLLEQAEPEAYDPKFKKWSIADLPIVPEQWQLVAKSKTKKQFNTVKKLIKSAKTIVNAGDPDREGQLLIDEMINFCGATKTQKEQTLRCLISDLNPSAVKQAINNLKPNLDFLSLSVSALSRARADWLYGINMTRMSTIKGQQAGYQGVLSIGRVQTPVLGLVVYRDWEIANFVSKPFYEVEAQLNTQAGASYIGKWQPSEACQPYMDEEGRVLVKGLAENVASRVKNQPGEVSKDKSTQSKKSRPLPHSLSTLQIEAAKVFGMNAQLVLDTCQSLYERHKLITYPRSDCRYLPKDHYKERSSVVGAIDAISDKLSAFTDKANLEIKSSAWNDSKVGAHHAIIPTSKKSSGALNQNEQNVYYLIARHYLAQFFEPSIYAEREIHTLIQGGLFTSKFKSLIDKGWEVLFNKQEKGEAELTQVPMLQKGEQVQCVDSQVIEKHTTPPKHFTDATLLAAMTGIARYVTEPEIKKILKETDGIGTEATRAGIIELLFKRQYLQRKGKVIHSTEIGQSVIEALPESVGRPDMTAVWEQSLEQIYQKSQSYNQFMGSVEVHLNRLLQDTQIASFNGLAGKGKASFKRFKKGKRSASKGKSSAKSPRAKSKA